MTNRCLQVERALGRLLRGDAEMKFETVGFEVRAESLASPPSLLGV